MADLQARTRSLDPARQAYAQARAGLPVTVCPFCGGAPEIAMWTRGWCCCGSCHSQKVDERVDVDLEPHRTGLKVCLECPHRPAGEP